MFTTVNQITMYYEERGKGLPVVFLHGYPLDHTIWNRVVARLEGQARLITPDLRGHGLSEAPQGIYSMGLMASDIAVLMDNLEIQQAVLVGHSMGGYISLAFAKAFPDRLLGLGMVSSQAAADNPERKAARFETARSVEAEGVEGVAKDMSGRLSSQPELVEDLRRLIMKMNPTGVVGALQGIAGRAEMSARISNVCVPVAVIAGEADKLIPLERAQEMAQRFPDCKLTAIPQVGHMPMLEAPEEVANALSALIAAVEKIGWKEV